MKGNLEQLFADLIEAGYRPQVKTHLFKLPDTPEYQHENDQGWERISPSLVFGWVINAHPFVNGRPLILGDTCPTLAIAIEKCRTALDLHRRNQPGSAARKT